MPWWLWMLVGMALAVLELQVPGSFFLLGVGIGAIGVGALVSLGFGGPTWLQWLLFSMFSVTAVLLFRRLFLHGQAARWTSTHEIDSLVGQEVVVADDVPAGGVGRVELRGTVWSARSTSGSPLAKGQRCRVARVEGLTLWVGEA